MLRDVALSATDDPMTGQYEEHLQQAHSSLSPKGEQETRPPSAVDCGLSTMKDCLEQINQNS